MDPRELILSAIAAREHSYCPYSSFAVGAALLGESGKIYGGCNIESCSYSPTNCAERTALYKAVSEGERRFLALAVVGGKQRGALQETAPCGVCRQVLYEFCPPGMPVFLAVSETDYTKTTLGELLPRGFAPDMLD